MTDAQGRDRVTRARERPYVATWGDQVRAMQGEAVDGVITTSLLPVGRAVRLDISLDPRRVTFVDHLRRPLTVETKPGARLVIPLRNRVLMLTKGVSGGELQMALRTGLAEPLPPIARWLRADAAQLTGDWALREPPSGAGSRFGPVLTPLAAAAPDGPLRSFATYTFDLPQAGRWLLQARVWCHDTGTNSWWVRPPGGDGPPLMLGNVIGSYDQWYWCPPLELDLPAGRVALQLAPREAAPGQGPLVSALCLSLAESGYEANDADAAVALSH